MTKIHRINYQELFALRQKYPYQHTTLNLEEVKLVEALMDAAIYRDTLEVYNRPQNS